MLDKTHNYDDTTQLHYEVPKPASPPTIKLWCVEDKSTPWKSILLKRGTLYEASHIEGGMPMVLDLGEPAPQPCDMARFRTREELPAWAIERVNYLRAEWQFIIDILVKAGHMAPFASLLHSGVYPQGFGWDSNKDAVGFTGDADSRQTKRWVPATETAPGHFEDGQDPLYAVPSSVYVQQPQTTENHDLAKREQLDNEHVPFDPL